MWGLGREGGGSGVWRGSVGWGGGWRGALWRTHTIIKDSTAAFTWFACLTICHMLHATAISHIRALSLQQTSLRLDETMGEQAPCRKFEHYGKAFLHTALRLISPIIFHSYLYTAYIWTFLVKCEGRCWCHKIRASTDNYFLLSIKLLKDFTVTVWYIKNVQKKALKCNCSSSPLSIFLQSLNQLYQFKLYCVSVIHCLM